VPILRIVEAGMKLLRGENFELAPNVGLSHARRIALAPSCRSVAADAVGPAARVLAQDRSRMSYSCRRTQDAAAQPMPPPPAPRRLEP
jgi:hypothetical protein